uniref:Uncharacterized protein n=1 Tax=Setaria italica TaxID=4555 RepID=K3Y1X4_SETIT
MTRKGRDGSGTQVSAADSVPKICPPRRRTWSQDLTGRVVLYDPESRSIRSAPSFSAPKFAPISMAVGSSCYVLDTDFTLNNRSGCFDRFSHDDDRWWYSLPPPPYVYTYSGMSSHVDSYAVVGTHCFDTARHFWTKAGDWILPFCGHVHYVPEHKLWFGGDLTPPEWTSKSSYLVHLDKSRFCHARFFQIKRPVDLHYYSYAVFTGMEGGNAGGELRVVKHRSGLYRLVNKLFHWVL